MKRLVLQVHVAGQDPRRVMADGPITIGRAAENDLVLDLPQISSHHAIFERKGEGWCVRDLDSLNGTFVNGARVGSSAVGDGDQVMLARVHVAVRLVDRQEQDPANTVHVVRGTRRETVESVIDSEEIGTFRPAAHIDDPEDLRLGYEKLRHAHALSMRIGVEHDPEQMMREVLAFSFRIVRADYGIALLEEPGTGEWEPLAVRRRDPQESSTVLVSRTVMDRVRRTGDALLLHDTGEDTVLRGAESICLSEARSLLAVPFKIQGETRGMLFLASTHRTGAFKHQDLSLMTGVTMQASQSLERARILKDYMEEVETRRTLSRFLSPVLVEQVQRGQVELNLEPQLRKMVILFGDMRDFTRFTQSVKPRDAAHLLDRAFTRMESAIFDHEGLLEKFVGDALMALWGYPVEQGDDPARAVRCALAMQHQVRLLSDERLRAGRSPVAFGIALHVGEAVIGGIGSARRMDFTAHGDSVNLTARLSGHARPGEVLVSAPLAAHLGSAFSLVRPRELSVKGRRGTVTVYTVKGPAADGGAR